MPLISRSYLSQVLDLSDWRLTNHQLRKAAILREVANAPAGSRVLDVGCAGGDIAIESAAMGYQVKGIDMEEHRIELARSIAADFDTDVPFEISDAAGLSRLGETFDVIIMGEILEHFFEPWKILEEIAPLCAPGAVLIVTTPNMASLHARLKLFFLGMFPDHNPEHLYFYTRRRFLEMLEKSPFEMVICRTILPMLIPNLGPLTSVERLFWRGVNFVVRGIGEHLMVVCRLRVEQDHSGS